MEYNVYTLNNGIRLLHVPAASAISHACIIVNSGARDEQSQQMGLAHFIEHLIFKRTAKITDLSEQHFMQKKSRLQMSAALTTNEKLIRLEISSF